jgi:NADH-quinone oxidoreductase subunit N
VSGSISQFFTGTDYLLSLPIILLTLFALGILLIDLMLPPEWKWANAVTALLGVFFAAAGVWRIQQAYAKSVGHVTVQTGFMQAMIVDRFAIYFFYLFLAATAIAILMSVRYLEIEHENHGEFYALMLFSVVGMMCMAAGNDIVLIFIGLELMAISTYILVGFLRRDRRSNEAALKYLLLGAFSSGIFAYGLSLFYGLSGGTNLQVISIHMQRLMMAGGSNLNPIVVLALLATTTGLFFKIAAVPFHQWAPDAYEGAPTSMTGFMSVAVKAAAWAMLMRILLWGLYPLRTIYVPLLIFVSIGTMTGGNLAALTQNNLKRLLAYSSIAHVGYMLLGLIALSSVDFPSPGFLDGYKGILLYLLVYTFMNLGAFAVVTSLRQRDVIGDEIDDIAGLYFRAPTEAILMLIFLLSLAGIPPLAGFYGKYFIFLSLIESRHYVLASIAVLYAVFGLYYYMRIASAMLMRQPEEKEALPISWGMRTALGVTAFATVFIGIFPERFIEAVTWSLGLVQATPASASLLR